MIYEKICKIFKSGEVRKESEKTLKISTQEKNTTCNIVLDIRGIPPVLSETIDS